MIKGKKTLTLLLLGSMFFLNGIFATNVTAAPANSIWVSPAGDDQSGTGSSAAPYKTITFALTKLSGGDTLLLKGGDYAENVAIANMPEFIMMAANPADTARIVAPADGPAIDYTPGTAATSLSMKIKHLVLTHTANSTGPGLQITNGELSLNECVVRNNSSSVSGGGIRILNDQPNLKPVFRRNRIYNNSAPSGGGLYSQGGAVVLDENKFYADSTTGGSGGAVLLKKAFGLSISKNDFYNNRADSGAALAIFSTQAAQLTSNNLLNNTFYFNSAQIDGGALYYEGSTVTFVMDGNVLAENSSLTDGGAFYLKATSTVILKKNIVVNNHAVGFGGAGALVQIAAAVNIWNNSFTQNRADVDGGALYLDAVGTLNVGTASSLKNNIFHNRGGNLLNNIHAVTSIQSHALNNNYWGTTDQSSIISSLGIPNVNDSWTTFESSPASIIQKLFHRQQYLWFADGRLNFGAQGIKPAGDSIFVARTMPDTNFTIASTVTALPKSYTFDWSGLKNNGAGVKITLFTDESERVLLGNPAPSSLQIYAENGNQWSSLPTTVSTDAGMLETETGNAPFNRYAIGKNAAVVDSGFNVFPLPNQTDLAPIPLIQIGFTQEMDAASMVPGAVQLYGSQSGAHSMALNYDPLDRILWVKPLLPFAAGERVRAVVTGLIHTAQGTPIDGYSWAFQIGAFSGRGQFISDPVKVVAGQRQLAFNQWQTSGAPQMIRVSPTLLEVLQADGSGVFQLEASQALGADFSRLRLADLNKDGRNEIILLNDTRLQVFEYNADASFSSVMDTSFAAISTLNDVRIADFNLDGTLDFAFLRDYSDFREMQIYQGAFRNGSFHLTAKAPVSLNGAGNRLAVMDINLDGQPDLTALQGASINDMALLYNGSGTFSPSFPGFTDISNPDFLLNANVWQDGTFENQKEIIVTGVNIVSEPQLKVYDVDASKNLVEKYTLALTAGINDMQVADLNSDGFNDLLLALNDGHIEIIYSDHGALLTQQMINTSFVPNTVETVDIDGDGDLDIFISGDDQGNLQTQLFKNVDRVPRSWFVDARAAANGDGSSALPLKTINEAVARSINGDIIKIAAGAYKEFVDIDHDLTLEASGNVQLEVPGTAGIVNNLLTVHGAAHFQLSDFDFTNPQFRSGITALNFANVDDMSMTGVRIDGFDTAAELLKTTGNLNGFQATKGSMGIKVDSSNVTVSNLEIHDFDMYGIRINASTVSMDSGRVYENVTQGVPGYAGIAATDKSVLNLSNFDVSRNGNANIYLNDADLTLQFSQIREAGILSATGGNGIVARQGSSFSMANSIVVKNPRAGLDSKAGLVQITNSVFAFNDSLGQNSGGAVLVETVGNSVVGNSVFFRNGQAIKLSKGNLSIRYNDFYQNVQDVSGTALGLGNLNKAPMFVYDHNPIGPPVAPDHLRSFKPAPGSPLIDAGNPLKKNGASMSRSDMGVFGDLDYPFGITESPDAQLAVIDTTLQLSWQLPENPARNLWNGVAIFRGDTKNFAADSSHLLSIRTESVLSYLDNTVSFGKNYYYKLAFIDSNGASMAYSDVLTGRPDTYKLSAGLNHLKVQLRIGDELLYTIPLQNDSPFPFRVRLKPGLPFWIQAKEDTVNMAANGAGQFTLRFSATDLSNDSLYHFTALFTAIENRSLEIPLDLEMLVSNHDQLLPETQITSFLPDTLQQSAFSITFAADDTSRSTIGTRIKDMRFGYSLSTADGDTLKKGTTSQRALHFYNLANNRYHFSVAAIDTAGNGAFNLNGVGRDISIYLPPLHFRKNVWQLVTLPRDMARSENKIENKDIRAVKRWGPDGYYDVKIDSMIPGAAYWVFNTKIINVDLENFSEVAADTSFHLAIRAGWNMIGNPWSWDIDWQRLQLIPASNPDVRITYEQAVNSQLISGDKTYYSSQKSNIGYDVEKDNIMRKGRGYWLFSKKKGTLVMDPQPSQPEQTGALEKNNNNPGLPGMDKIVHITLTDGPYVDGNNYFGVCDKLDNYPYFYRHTQEPPAVFESPRLYAVKNGQKLTANLLERNEMDSLLVWDLQMENANKKDKTVLSWNSPSDDNDIYYYLYHLESGTWFNMAEMDSFKIKSPQAREHFKLYATTDENFRPRILPVKFSLGQNYPNPFNPETQIRLTVPFFADGVKATLDVYDVLGRKIKNLINKPLKSGEIKVRWDGRNGIGQRVASGVYFYRFHAGKYMASKKMVLIR